MEIKRDKYLNRLIKKKENGLIKVITGIRSSGKSYLLFNIYYDYLISEGVPEENIIAISLDDEECEKYRDPHILYERTMQSLVLQLCVLLQRLLRERNKRFYVLCI